MWFGSVNYPRRSAHIKISTINSAKLALMHFESDYQHLGTIFTKMYRVLQNVLQLFQNTPSNTYLWHTPKACVILKWGRVQQPLQFVLNCLIPSNTDRWHISKQKAFLDHELLQSCTITSLILPHLNRVAWKRTW